MDSLLKRRDFIRLSILSGTALAVGCVPSAGKEATVVNLAFSGPQGMELGAFIFIEGSGHITIYNHRPEMGQGTYQAIPMIIADELGARMEDVEIRPSPADREKYGDQMVVGSRSINSNYDWMRKVGAAAREMLIQAAANRWKVDKTGLRVESGNVISQDGERLPYGDLVAAASKLPAPEEPKLKDPSAFTLIGKSLPRQDIPLKTNGAALFGLDAQVPGLLYASIERSPMFVGKIIRFNDEKCKQVPGVRYVFKTQRDVWGTVREGVAVLADTYWAAAEGRKALVVDWDHGDLEKYNTSFLWEDYSNAAKSAGVTFREQGDFAQAFAKSAKKIEVAYKTPYQSHACMEPMNATVSVEGDRCRFWGSTQNPNGNRSFLAKKLGIPEENVEINYTFMGGGFGRRSMTDVVEEAADLSKQAGAPVKVIWTREDDLTQGPFRACSLNVCRGAVDDQGQLVALEHKVICQDIRNQAGGDDKPSGSMAGGITTDYSVANFRIAGILRKHHVPITYWRSVYHSTNCFAHESAVDELAHLAKRDPLAFRMDLLKDHPRFTKVLEVVRKKAAWDAPHDKSVARGVAIVERSGAYVALVAEVARVDGKVRPAKITAAIDCGRAVNPDIVRAQTEGGIVMGLTAAYKSGLTLESGKIRQQNYDTYRMLEMGECPEIEVTVIDSGDPPEGAGEAGLPPTAPALTNAIYALTGKRIRELPFDLNTV